MDITQDRVDVHKAEMEHIISKQSNDHNLEIFEFYLVFVLRNLTQLLHIE